MEPKQLWPSFRYGPNGEAQIFDRAEDVPEGWEDHPSKFAKAESEAVVSDPPGNSSTGDVAAAPVSASDKPKRGKGKGKGKGKKAEKKAESEAVTESSVEPAESPESASGESEGPAEALPAEEVAPSQE